MYIRLWICGACDYLWLDEFYLVVGFGLDGSVAQWLGHRSGWLSLTYAWSMVDRWPLSAMCQPKRPTPPFIPPGSLDDCTCRNPCHCMDFGDTDHQTADHGCVWLLGCRSKSIHIN